jgi:hypothetical protein
MPADREPYDPAQPFNPEEPERQVPVDLDSPLGRAMAEARQAWAQSGYVPLDPDTFTDADPRRD